MRHSPTKPPAATRPILEALKPLPPVFLTYVLSFIYLGIYWNNHHHLLKTHFHVTAGSNEWWRKTSAQSEAVVTAASKAADTREMVWGDAPPGAHLPFVLIAAGAGKDYRLAKMVTNAANPAQAAYFRHDRVSLFGTLPPDGTIAAIPPLDPPPPPPLTKQGEFF